MKEYKTIENGLIPVMENEKGEKLVDARLLHKFLEVGTKFSDWIKDRIEKYKFTKDIDFTSFPKKEKAENTWINTIEYILTLDVAKELSMVETTEKGSEARKYFIGVEKKYKQDKNNSIDKLKLEQQGLKFAIEILKPSEVSTVKMIKSFNESQGLSTAYLPVYSDEEAALSATELLKKFDVKISVIKFNKILIEKGILIEKQRPSKSKGVKKYKALTELGLQYGKNVISTRGSEQQTQALFYENKFQKLVSLVIGVKE